MVSNNPPEKYEHKHYKHCEEKDCDAVAWAFLNEKTQVKFPYKHPELKDDEIRIRNTYIGLCHSDVLTCRKRWFENVNYPLAPGHEIVGIVEAVGKNVKKFKVGDKAGFGVFRDCCGVCKPCKLEEENYCTETSIERFTYGEFWGGYSTHLQQPEKLAFKLPEGLKEELTSPIFCAGLTVWAPIKRFARPGDKCAVVGIGGLGHLAVQYLHKLGFHVTAVSTSTEPEKIEWIKKLGANEVISTDKEVLDKHNGKFDFVINTAPANKGFEDILGLGAVFGNFVQVGLPDSSAKLPVPAFHLTGKRLNLVGTQVGSYKEMIELLDFTVKHDVYPLCEIFDFEDLPKGFDRIEKGRPKFRVVVKCKDYQIKSKF